MTDSEDLKLRKTIEKMMDNGFGKVIIARELGISEGKASRVIKKIREGHPEEELREELRIVKIQKKLSNLPTSGSILVVGDAHSHPEHSNERFTKLGKLIKDLKPDNVVQIGDFLDMPSLSSYDVGKKSFEGRRYKRDLEIGFDAFDRIEKGMKGYSPRKFVTIGNHENRINKAVNNDPKLEGTMSIDNIKFEEYGWEVVPFLEPLELMGITFQHYFTSGSMDRAISGENVGKAILKKYHSSCLAGHNHLLNLATEANAKGKLMVGGTVGCYFEHIEPWQSIAAQNHFWRGVIYLEDVKDGVFGKGSEITLEYINNHY